VRVIDDDRWYRMDSSILVKTLALAYYVCVLVSPCDDGGERAEFRRYRRVFALVTDGTV